MHTGVDVRGGTHTHFVMMNKNILKLSAKNETLSEINLILSSK